MGQEAGEPPGRAVPDPRVRGLGMRTHPFSGELPAGARPRTRKQVDSPCEAVCP